MIGWMLILTGGLLGSAHCIGMCGALAVTVGAGAPSLRVNLLVQGLYSLGRIFTYGVMGVATAFLSLRLRHTLGAVASFQSLLAIVAGIALVAVGVLATGVLPRRGSRPGTVGCLAASFFRSFLLHPTRLNVFLAGMFNGLLPCGLVYAYLALAASSGSIWIGMLTMVVFGCGTVPAMMLAGVGAPFLSQKARVRLVRLAAWCVVLTGVLSLARGFGFIVLAGGDGAPICPLCAAG